VNRIKTTNLPPPLYNKPRAQPLSPQAKFDCSDLPPSQSRILPFFANKGFISTTGTSTSFAIDKQLDASKAKIQDLRNCAKTQISLTQAAYKGEAGAKREPAPKYKVKGEVEPSPKYQETFQPTDKLADNLTGPYNINKTANPNAVRLNQPTAFGTIHPTFYALQLGSALAKGQRKSQSYPFSNNKEGDHEVPCFLKSRYSG